MTNMDYAEIANLLIRKAILEAIIRQGEIEQDPLLIPLEDDTDREHPKARLQLVMIEEQVEAWKREHGPIPAEMKLNIVSNQPGSAADEGGTPGNGKPPAQVVRLKRLDMRGTVPALKE